MRDRARRLVHWLMLARWIPADLRYAPTLVDQLPYRWLRVIERWLWPERSER
jgi:hypothetical protein